MIACDGHAWFDDRGDRPSECWRFALKNADTVRGTGRRRTKTVIHEVVEILVIYLCTTPALRLSQSRFGARSLHRPVRSHTRLSEHLPLGGLPIEGECRFLPHAEEVVEQAQTLVESDFPYAGIHVAEASGQVSADAGEESTGLLDAALGHGHGNACPLRQQ